MEARKTRARGTVAPDVSATDGKVTVTSTYGGKTRDRVEKIEVRKFSVEPAFVRVCAGMTKNMGNYESLRVDVACTLPCYAEEVDKVLPVVADKVAAFLEEELKNYE